MAMDVLPALGWSLVLTAWLVVPPVIVYAWAQRARRKSRCLSQDQLRTVYVRWLLSQGLPLEVAKRIAKDSVLVCQYPE